MTLQLLKLISFYAIVFILGQEQNEFSYVRCVDERVTEIFVMKTDSSITRREYGERWKEKNKVIGMWQKKKDLLIWKINGETNQFYVTDTLSMLQFLIPNTEMQDWLIIKRNLKKNISENQDIQMFKSLTVTNADSKDSEDAIAHLEFDIALKFICGEKILIKTEK